MGEKKTKLCFSLLRVFDFVVTHRNDIAPKKRPPFSESGRFSS